MSATVNAELFVQYFNQCPVITVPGRTFPVQAFYLEDVVEMTGYLLEEESEFAIRRNILQNQKTFMVSKLGEGKQEMTVDTFYEDGIACEDDEALASLKSKCSAQTIRTLGWMNEDLVNYELIEALLDYIVRTDDDGSGSILIFLPGIGEIRELNDRLLANRNLLEVLWILPLHSSFSPDEQARVFKPSPSKNLRKVVLSTNIAETGVTIPDCTIVIGTYYFIYIMC
jgi:ATP-dependent RNA helicase DHX29